MTTLAFPLRVVDNRLVTVEVDSAEHIAQCVEAAALTEEGWRVEAPDFGVAPFLMHAGATDLDELRAAIVRSEPRASVIAERIDDYDDLRAERIRILIDEVT